MSRLWCGWPETNEWSKTCGGAVTNMLNVINMWLASRGVSRNQGEKCWCVFNSISKIKGQSATTEGVGVMVVVMLLFTLLWAYQPGLPVFTWTLVTYHLCWLLGFHNFDCMTTDTQTQRFYFESEYKNIHSEIIILSNWLTIKQLKSTWCN